MSVILVHTFETNMRCFEVLSYHLDPNFLKLRVVFRFHPVISTPTFLELRVYCFIRQQGYVLLV